MLKPAYKLTIGRKANDTSGPLGAVSGAASGLLGGGSKIIDTTDEPQASTVVELTVALDMDSPADRYTLVMGQVGSFRVSRDNEVTVELGYAGDDELTQVMMGGVISVEPGLITNRVSGHSAAETLLHTFVDQTYESKTAAQIVRDLAGQAGVAVATAETGITFPAYVIDGRRNLYRHMRNLADLCGFDLYFNAANELVFEKFSGGNTVHVFEYAKHIIALNRLERLPQAGQVEAWGESSQPGDAWAWLTKDFDNAKGSAGSGGTTQLLEQPALRTGRAAQTAAEAAQTRLQRQTIRGHLLIAGRPQVKLGDAIRLQGVPEEALNEVYQVRSVTHRITKREGFTTTVGFRSIGEGGGGGTGGLGSLI